MPSSPDRASARRLLGVLFFCSLTLCLWLGQLPARMGQVNLSSTATAQTVEANQLVQQGVERYQAGDFRGAIEFWQTALADYEKAGNRAHAAVVLGNLANAYQDLGQVDRAIGSWEQGIAQARQLGNRQALGRMLTEAAQSYSSLGQYRQVITLLCGEAKVAPQCEPDSALVIARTQADRLGEVAALGSLGEAHRLRGEYDPAIAYLTVSFELATQLGNSDYQAAAANGLGNAQVGLANLNYRRANSASQQGSRRRAQTFSQRALDYDRQAVQHFQASLDHARRQNNLHDEVQVLINLIPPADRTGQAQLANQARQSALGLLARLPDSRTKVYAAINLVNLLQPVSLTHVSFAGTQCLQPQAQGKAVELLQQAVAMAQKIQDSRAQSFALGQLGHLYECRGEYDPAMTLTRQAQVLADQNLLAKDSLYLWEWQAGRIFQAQEKDADALSAYEQAIAALESIRGDILSAGRDLQFDFRDTVEPVYRGLAELRLQRVAATAPESAARERDLGSVLSTIDALKLAELQNYFGNDCVLTALGPQRVDLAGRGSATAVFSSILFEQRTAILLSLPNGDKKYRWIEIDRSQFTQQINEFRRELERGRIDLVYNPQRARALYDQLIRPFDQDLQQAKISTLVFIQDGILRSIPISALHDGEQFLIQKYAVATTPSLTLTDLKALDRQELRVLAMGLTQAATVEGQQFPALDNVSLEISGIKAQIPSSKQLLDGEFTRARLQQELSQNAYAILHIATHGEFGNDPKDTFLVTGDNRKLTITDLEAMLRSVGRGAGPVELLTLTACQTAVGDDRASLGLAGVAVQAGVKSALASLWSIDDASTARLVNQFYAGLRDPNLSKAEALQAAQQALIAKGGRYAHPLYWAPLILVGNWL